MVEMIRLGGIKKGDVLLQYIRHKQYTEVKTKGYIEMDVKNRFHKLSYIQTILTCIGFDSILDFSKRIPLDNIIQCIKDNIDTIVQYAPLHKVHFDDKNRNTFNTINVDWNDERILQYINVPLRKEFGITIVKDKHKNKSAKNMMLHSSVFTPFHYDFTLLDIFGFNELLDIACGSNDQDIIDAIGIQVELIIQQFKNRQILYNTCK